MPIDKGSINEAYGIARAVANSNLRQYGFCNRVSGGYMKIGIVVDRLSKEIIPLHGVTKSIMSDCDKIFLSKIFFDEEFLSKF